MIPNRRSLLVAALASALALPAMARAEEGAPNPDGDKVPCWGVNRCKGVGACSAEGCRAHGCHGSNACKRQGFLRIEAETCTNIVGGRLTKAVPAKKSIKKAPATK